MTFGSQTADHTSHSDDQATTPVACVATTNRRGLSSDQPLALCRRARSTAERLGRLAPRASMRFATTAQIACTAAMRTVCGQNLTCDCHDVCKLSAGTCKLHSLQQKRADSMAVTDHRAHVGSERSQGICYSVVLWLKYLLMYQASQHAVSNTWGTHSESCAGMSMHARQRAALILIARVSASTRGQ